MRKSPPPPETQLHGGPSHRESCAGAMTDPDNSLMAPDSAGLSETSIRKRAERFVKEDLIGG